jgi:hypothetical protein
VVWQVLHLARSKLAPDRVLKLRVLGTEVRRPRIPALHLAFRGASRFLEYLWRLGSRLVNSTWMMQEMASVSNSHTEWATRIRELVDFRKKHGHCRRSAQRSRPPYGQAVS